MTMATSSYFWCVSMMNHVQTAKRYEERKAKLKGKSISSDCFLSMCFSVLSVCVVGSGDHHAASQYSHTKIIGRGEKTTPNARALPFIPIPLFSSLTANKLRKILTTSDDHIINTPWKLPNFGVVC